MAKLKLNWSSRYEYTGSNVNVHAPPVAEFIGSYTSLMINTMFFMLVRLVIAMKDYASIWRSLNQTPA